MFFIRKTQLAREPSTFFLSVKCSGCGNEQVIFSAASRVVLCLGCNQVLAASGPSKIILKSKVVKSF